MENTTIELKYEREIFEEIFFTPENQKTFFHEQLKIQRYLLGISFVLLIGAIVYGYFDKKTFGLALFLLVVFGALVIEFVNRLSKIYAWRRDVKTYLNDLNNYKQMKVILTEHSLTLLLDDKETIEKWSEFKSMKVEENHLSAVSSTTSYLFPKRSMQPEEYELLKRLFSEKLKSE